MNLRIRVNPRGSSFKDAGVRRSSVPTPSWPAVELLSFSFFYFFWVVLSASGLVVTCLSIRKCSAQALQSHRRELAAKFSFTFAGDATKLDEETRVIPTQPLLPQYTQLTALTHRRLTSPSEMHVPCLECGRRRTAPHVVCICPTARAMRCCLGATLPLLPQCTQLTALTPSLTSC